MIVCDYQLSRGLTGVDAIEGLRVPQCVRNSSASHQHRCDLSYIHGDIENSPLSSGSCDARKPQAISPDPIQIAYDQLAQRAEAMLV